VIATRAHVPAHEQLKQRKEQQQQQQQSSWKDLHQPHHFQLLKVRRQAPAGTFPEMTGIGVNLQRIPKYMMYEITAIAPNGGAALNGQISIGDVIFTVDGQDVAQLELPAVIQIIKGRINTYVTLVVQKGSAFVEGRRQFDELQMSHVAQVKLKQEDIKQLEQDVTVCVCVCVRVHLYTHTHTHYVCVCVCVCVCV